MKDIVEDYLDRYGPCLSSKVSEYLVNKHKLTPSAARKRVSRATGRVRRLAYITFPRRARFIYLQQQFGSPHYWERLIETLIQTKSAYGLAIAAIHQRGGLIPLDHFAIACGAPLRQARHLSPHTIFERLNQAGLLQKIDIPVLGECISLVQSAGHYDGMAGDARVRLLTEEFLLVAIRDWVRKLGIVSYGKPKTRNGDSQPRVGTFAWDLTAPSYLGFMVKADRDGQVKPGFLACDVYMGNEVSVMGIQPFINKCVTLRTLRNVGPCMQMFVADRYSHDAFQNLKKHGIIPATPSSLFGNEVAEGLATLSQVLRDAAKTAIDPERFDNLFKKLGKIEGASTQLRGTLFEYLVADVTRKRISPNVQMNRVYKLPDGTKAEADVIVVEDHKSVTFIECKGYNPNAQVPDGQVQRWLQRNVPLFYREIRAHPDWKGLKVYFQLWTTGSLSDAALAMIEQAQKKIKAARYTIELYVGPEILEKCKSTRDAGLVTAFRKHFMKV